MLGTKNSCGIAQEATGGGSPAGGPSPAPQDNVAQLFQLLKEITPEAKWFLRALQHFSSKVEDRAEIRLYDYEDPSDGFIATTHKSSLHIGLGENLLCFSFKRKITAPPATSLGRWCLPIKEEKGKAIIREVREAVLKVPLPLGEILEIVKKIDDIIREEEVGGEEEEE